MTILTMNRAELEKKVGKISKDVEEKITMMGTPVEEITSDSVSVEVFPNRPDLLSLSGFSRSLLQYLGKAKISNFKIENEKKIEKDYNVKIDKSVKKVRPHTACAIVKGLKLNDEKIKEIIDIQEKLHMSIGRKRKKIAIGVYPLEKIKLPIQFMAKKPNDIKFVPLESPGLKEMTGAQILRSHPAGREYADLLKDTEVYPIFVDANEKVMSMPPIINSHETGKIDEKTKEVFIECSGFNLPYLKKCLNIIVSAFSEIGGKIYSVKINDLDGDFISPDLEPEKLEFKISDINKTLGLELNEKEIKSYLERMGIGFEPGKDAKNKEKSIALIPAYRTDILHWIDLTEEIAIAYGYENFKPEIPAISTTAEEDKNARTKKVISNILAGLGLLECSSFHLAKKNDVKKMHYEMLNEDFIEILDSKTEYDVLRVDLLSNLLKIFSENSDSQYPQKIFEIGKVFSKDKTGKSETGIIEKEKLSIALADESVNFMDARQILDYLLKMLDIEQDKYKIEDTENSDYISGRVGKIIVYGKEVGFIGEVAPRVLKNWKIKMPVSAFEIDLEAMGLID